MTKRFKPKFRDDFPRILKVVKLRDGSMGYIANPRVHCQRCIDVVGSVVSNFTGRKNISRISDFYIRDGHIYFARKMIPACNSAARMRSIPNDGNMLAAFLGRDD